MRILRKLGVKKLDDVKLIGKLQKAKLIITIIENRKLQYLLHVIRGKRYHLL